MATETPFPQAHIDALLAFANEPQGVHDRILEFAERGIEAPESLSLKEIKQICFAISAHYRLSRTSPNSDEGGGF